MTGLGSESRPRRQWIWVLVALLTAGVVIGSLTVTFGLKGGFHHETDPLPSYRRTISELQVQSNAAGSFTILAGQPGLISVHSKLAWVFSKPVVTESWHGSVLSIGATCPKFSLFGDCEVNVTVGIPAGTAVVANAGAGNVAVRGLTGALHLSATAGSVAVSQVSGPLFVSVTSGSVAARGLTSPTVQAMVTSGQIDLRFTSKPRRLSLVVGAGSADVTLPPGSRYVVASVVGPGLLSVAPGLADPNSGAVITAAVGSGAARIGYGPAGG